MSLFDAVRYRMRAVFDRAALEAERQAEFRFHQSLEQQQQRHVGLSDDEARLASRRSFGSEVYYQEEVRQMSLATRLDDLARNLRLGVRSLARAPEFTLATVLTLGLGIGGLAAVMALVTSVLLRPLPYPEQDRLVGISMNLTKLSIETSDHSDASYFLLQDFSRAHAIGSYNDRAQVNLSDGDEPERVRGVAATAGFFRVLGGEPLLGRFYTDEEDRPGAPPVIVFSEGIWRRRYGGDPSIVGRVVTIDGQPTEVVGVMPAGLAFPDAQVQVWVPMRFDRANVLPVSTSNSIIARLAEGVTLEAAAADFQQAIDRLPEWIPTPDSASRRGSTWKSPRPGSWCGPSAT